MDQEEDRLVDCLSNHFPSWDEFSIKFMQDVFKVVSLNRFFGIKKLKEFLNKLWSDINLQRSYLNGFVDNKLQEKLVDTLNMWPGRFNFLFLFNTGLREG